MESANTVHPNHELWSRSNTERNHPQTHVPIETVNTLSPLLSSLVPLLSVKDKGVLFADGTTESRTNSAQVTVQDS